jgi:hypothetical protein
MFHQIMRRLPIIGNRLPSLSMLREVDQWQHLPAWFRSRRPNYLLDNAIPWITYDAAAYLRAHLQPGIRVFEYGSGASTLFWARYAIQCVSIEHDAEWYALVKTRLQHTDALDYRLVLPDPSPPDQAASLDRADPRNYLTDWIGFEQATFRNYAQQIDVFPEVKVAGMLILDNADVPLYLEQTQHLLADFKRLSFAGIAPIQGIPSRTDIYIRQK